MTKKELSRYFWLKNEVKAQRRRLAILEKREAESHETIGDTVLNYNSGKGIPVRIEGIPKEAFTLPVIIKTLRQQIEQNINESKKVLTEIEEYIQEIPDPKTREVMRGRFIDCLRWEDIGRKNYIAADYARRIAREYLKDNS